jgi:hypothetical protein
LRRSRISCQLCASRAPFAYSTLKEVVSGVGRCGASLFFRVRGDMLDTMVPMVGWGCDALVYARPRATSTSTARSPTPTLDFDPPSRYSPAPSPRLISPPPQKTKPYYLSASTGATKSWKHRDPAPQNPQTPTAGGRTARPPPQTPTSSPWLKPCASSLKTKYQPSPPRPSSLATPTLSDPTTPYPQQPDTDAP